MVTRQSWAAPVVQDHEYEEQQHEAANAPATRLRPGKKTNGIARGTDSSPAIRRANSDSTTARRLRQQGSRQRKTADQTEYAQFAEPAQQRFRRG
jgi:hypothetical protein